MGTSLNGLTPAGTYPGLIKTGDNAPIDGTLKTLSDGNGNNLPMEASTTAVNFTGTLTQAGATLQPTLVSGTNIKTINGTSLLGSGNIPVVTSPSGVAGAIQFSDGSAFASDASNLFWDDTNNRLGIGTNAPTGRLQVVTDDATNPQVFSNQTSILAGTASQGALISAFSSTNGAFLNALWPGNAWFKMNYGALQHIFSNAGNVNAVIDSNTTFGAGTSSLGARVGIRGSGSTSATTSLLVQNSAGTSALTVKDDLSATFGGTAIASNFAGTGYFSLSSEQRLVIGVPPNRTLLIPIGSGILCMSDGSEADFNRLQFGGTTSSYPSLKRNGTAIDVRLADDSNYAGFNTGATTIKGSGTTSATSSLIVANNAGTTALEVLDDSRVKLGNSSDFTVYSGAGVVSRFAMNIGSTSLPTAQLQVKGSGSTSATTSLLVQNSSGTAALTVKDDLSTSVKILYIDNTIEGASSGRMNIISQYDLAIRPNNGGVGFAEGYGFNVNNSALIEMQSTTRGFLPPRMTTTQKNAIASPAAGLVVYDSTTNKLCCYNGSTWNDLF